MDTSCCVSHTRQCPAMDPQTQLVTRVGGWAAGNEGNGRAGGSTERCESTQRKSVRVHCVTFLLEPLRLPQWEFLSGFTGPLLLSEDRWPPCDCVGQLLSHPWAHAAFCTLWGGVSGPGFGGSSKDPEDWETPTSALQSSHPQCRALTGERLQASGICVTWAAPQPCRPGLEL